MITKKEGVEMLGAVPMFADLSKRDLGKLWDQIKIVEHRPGHTIIHEGRGGQGFHLILDGEAVVSRGSKRVKLGPGHFFGEMSLIDDGPRTADVASATRLTTATISAWEFKSVVKKQPEVVWKLLVHMTQRLREEQSISAGMTS